MKNKKIAAALSLAAITAVLAAADTRLKITEYQIITDKLSEEIRLAFVSDLHSCKYGKNQSELIKAIDRAHPDAVLYGGDIFDDIYINNNSLTLIKNLVKKYPSYYVTGNHELRCSNVDTIKSTLKDIGVFVLEGGSAPLLVGDDKIYISGADDPLLSGNDEFLQKLNTASESSRGFFSVLLTHRPELAEEYNKMPFDLVLAGHAHGGQWRVPYLLNGLYAPDQGLFPKYAGGRCTFASQTLIVGRGLSRESTIIPRIFNRPELVIIGLSPV